MLPDAEEKASAYVAEEEDLLKEIIGTMANIQDKNFVVVGAGNIWYVEISYEKVKNYIAIEPLANIFIQKEMQYILGKHSNIHIIPNEFGDFDNSKLPDGNNIYVFHFNILSYIPDPITRINRYLKEGDVLYISSWNTTQSAKRVRKEYFDYLNMNTLGDSHKVDPTDSNELIDLDTFEFEKLKFYKNHKRIKGEITDILIINC